MYYAAKVTTRGQYLATFHRTPPVDADLDVKYTVVLRRLKPVLSTCIVVGDEPLQDLPVLFLTASEARDAALHIAGPGRRAAIKYKE